MKILYLTFDKVIRNAQYTLHHLTYTPAKFEVATSNSLGGDVFTRKYIFDLGVKVTQNVTQYPLHYVIYVSAKFHVATSLGKDTSTRNMTDGRTEGQRTGFGMKLMEGSGDILFSPLRPSVCPNSLMNPCWVL